MISKFLENVIEIPKWQMKIQSRLSFASTLFVKAFTYEKSFLENEIANASVIVVACNDCGNGKFNCVKDFLIPSIVIHTFTK